MRISKEAAPESVAVGDAGGALAEPFDVALVVVHGMGDAYTSQILLEWAEPLLGRLEWLARDPLIGGNREGFGVAIDQSTLAGDAPIISATVTFPKMGGAQGVARPDRAPTPDTVTRRIAIVEARWEDAFVPLDRRTVFKWAVPFLWRAISRMLRLFTGTLVLVPWYTLLRHLKADTKSLKPHLKSLLPKPINFIVDAIRLAAASVMLALITAFIVVLGIVLTPILPLLSPLLIFPWFSNVAKVTLDTLVESIGDVASWRERPVRASAMRMVVRDAVTRASTLVGEKGEVHVLAHSQGAAVATYTLLEEMVPDKFRVRRLTTVGAAVVLMGNEKWPGRTTPYRPVAQWQALNDKLPPDRRLVWQNHWATWDPFSAGPIADTEGDVRLRWRAAYFPELATVPDGPEEHAVHNTSQPFLDHSMYFDNVTQVIEPTALNLLGDEYPRPPEAVAYVENRLSVIDKKALGANMLAAVVIAAIVPGLPPVSQFFAEMLSRIAGFVAGVFDWFNGTAPAPPFAESVGWLRREGEPGQPDSLSIWGWIVAAGLILAVLVWANQWLHSLMKRSRTWERCPLNARTWLALTMIPRFAYALGAATAVFFAIVLWPDWVGWSASGKAWFLVGMGVLLVLIAVFVVFEPRFAPAPVIVPAAMMPNPVDETAPPADIRTTESTHLAATRESATTTPTKRASLATRLAVTAPQREPNVKEWMTLGMAMDSDDYCRERDTRRKNLSPEGFRARLWARLFHGWRAATATALTPAAGAAETRRAL